MNNNENGYGYFYSLLWPHLLFYQSVWYAFKMDDCLWRIAIMWLN